MCKTFTSRIHMNTDVATFEEQIHTLFKIKTNTLSRRSQADDDSDYL